MGEKQGVISDRVVRRAIEPPIPTRDPLGGKGLAAVHATHRARAEERERGTIRDPGVCQCFGGCDLRKEQRA